MKRALEFVLLGTIIAFTFLYLASIGCFFNSKPNSTKVNISPTPLAAVEKKTSFTIAGDVMLDRLINHKFKSDFTAILSDFDRGIFKKADLRILNLEGPISDGPIIDDVAVDNLVFNFPPESMDFLKFLNLNAVSLANNHSLNAGESGHQNTLKVLNEAGIIGIGTQSKVGPGSAKQFNTPLPLSVLAINLLDNDPAELVPYIEEEGKRGNFIFVFPHWGNEYAPEHNSYQEKAAKQWIAAGADLIIGSHPHVIQDAQIIDGVPVIYSLGNFVFDQTFSRETQQGLVISGVLEKEKISLTFLPTEQIHLKPSLISGSEKSRIVGKIIEGVKEESEIITEDTVIIKRKGGDV